MSPNIFDRFLNLHGIMFQIIHPDGTEEVLKGLVNSIDGKRVVQFMPKSNIQINDKLINPVGEVVYVVDKQTDFINGNPMELTAFIQTESERKMSLGIYSQLNAIRELVASKKSADSAQLNQIIDILSDISSSNRPLQQGMLSKFSAVMERNSWFTNALASLLLSMLIHM